MADVLQKWEATHCVLLNTSKGEWAIPTTCWELAGTSGLAVEAAAVFMLYMVRQLFDKKTGKLVCF